MVKDDKTTKEGEKETKDHPEIAELRQQLDESEAKWKRALADYQNLEKRIRDEKTDFVRFAAKNFIEKLLSVIDDLEKAKTHLKDPGLDLALKKLFDILKQEGVEKIDTKGKEYNIETMEALTVEEGKEDNRVVEEFRSGFTMHGSVLRPAQVKVSKKK